MAFLRVPPDFYKSSCVRHGIIDHGDVCPLCVAVNPFASLDEALDVVERPEDCNKPCWRHVDGGGQCECDDETEGGTWQPGC